MPRLLARLAPVDIVLERVRLTCYPKLEFV